MSCLLIIDMINPFTFPEATTMLPVALQIAERIERLKQRVRKAGMPVIYVNDNFGKWQHDLQTLVETCLHDECQGRKITKILKPDQEDYFVLKPKHSGFFATPLELLLGFLGARHLILTGIAGDNCILYTAADAYMRDFSVRIPSDCVASVDQQRNAGALVQMQTTLKADIRPSTELQFSSQVVKIQTRSQTDKKK